MSGCFWGSRREGCEQDENCGRYSLGGLCPAVSPRKCWPFWESAFSGGGRKKIAMAQHCKRSHELKMSSSYSSGLNWLEQISNLQFIWKPITIMSLHLQDHTWHIYGHQVSGLLWTWQSTILVPIINNNFCKTGLLFLFWALFLK